LTFLQLKFKNKIRKGRGGNGSNLSPLCFKIFSTEMKGESIWKEKRRNERGRGKTYLSSLYSIPLLHSNSPLPKCACL
jgi:hypothetical protein